MAKRQGGKYRNIKKSRIKIKLPRNSSPDGADESGSAKVKINKRRSKAPRSKSSVPKSKSRVKSSSRAKSKTKKSASSGKKTLFPFEKYDPAKMDAKEITRIFLVGKNRKFKTEEEVVEKFNYRFGKKLGQGGFGVVYVAINMKTGAKHACKQCNLGTNMKDTRILDMKNELFIMEKVKHLYVVKLGLHFITLNPKGNRLYLFMEMADGGDLYKFNKKNGPFPEDRAKLYLAQVVSGINHMHSLGIAHRDIKPQNVLLRKYPQSITGDFLLLVTDFGLSRIVHHDDSGEMALNKTRCGTPIFMAPEILTRKPYNAFMVDMWAIGVTLFMLITQEIPFQFRNKSLAIKKMLNREWGWQTEKMKSEPSNELNSFMKGLLEPNVSERFTMQQMLDHKWFSDAFKKAQIAARKKL